MKTKSARSKSPAEARKPIRTELPPAAKRTRTRKKAAAEKIPAKKSAAKKDIAASYNAFKEFEGQRYTGMKIGRMHRWYYDKGEWQEKKITPEKWEFTYNTVKRRKGKAPEGSGVPVGTEYHWYVLSHQTATKLDANSYTIAMTGVKYKVAHKRAATGKWSASDKAQRKKLIKIFQEMIAELEKDPAAEAPEPAKSIAKKENSLPGQAARRQGKKKIHKAEVVAL